MIRPIPQTYSGVQFRSTLEAEWAYNMDCLNVAWSYEPVALKVDGGSGYLPDFWLPEITTWLEVKGPNMPGMEKTNALRRAVQLATAPPWTDPDTGPVAVIVVGLLPVRGRMHFKVSDSYAGGWTDYPALSTCRKCGGAWWYDALHKWDCRRCGAYDGAHFLASQQQSGEPVFHRHRWPKPQPRDAA